MPPPLPLRTCLVCARPFTPYRHWQVYCCVACRRKGYWLDHVIIRRTPIPGKVL